MVDRRSDGEEVTSPSWGAEILGDNLGRPGGIWRDVRIKHVELICDTSIVVPGEYYRIVRGGDRHPGPGSGLVELVGDPVEIRALIPSDVSEIGNEVIHDRVSDDSRLRHRCRQIRRAWIALVEHEEIFVPLEDPEVVLSGSRWF